MNGFSESNRTHTNVAIFIYVHTTIGKLSSSEHVTNSELAQYMKKTYIFYNNFTATKNFFSKLTILIWSISTWFQWLHFFYSILMCSFLYIASRMKARMNKRESIKASSAIAERKKYVAIQRKVFPAKIMASEI